MAFNERKTLRIKWSKREKDFIIDYPSKTTGHMTNGLLGGQINFPEFLEELESRGYDLKTLKLTVNRRQFKCIKDFINEEKKIRLKIDQICYLKGIEGKMFQLSDDDGYCFNFYKYKSDGHQLSEYFEEIL